MDENYLDNLLEQVSPDKKQNNDFENIVDADADIDIDLSDLDDISLGEMDGLDDVDLSDLELDDIDFDDMDVTSLDAASVARPEEQPEEDFNLDSLLDGVSEEEFGQEPAEDIVPQETDEHMVLQEPAEDITQPFQDVFEDAEQQEAADIDFPEVMSEEEILGYNSAQPAAADADEPTVSADAENAEDMDLDALFSALGIEEEEGIREDDYLSGEDELEAQLQSSMEMSMESGELSDIEDISEVKPEEKVKKRKKKLGGKKSGGPKESKESKESKEKKSLSEIIFGKPDEDDIEEERILAEKKAEKQAKKEQQKEEKETKKAGKQETLELKKKADEKKRQDKENKKKQKQAELEAELEAEDDGKKVSTVTVIIVFVIFAALGVFVIFGTKAFNYTKVIHKAEDYFERQRYRLAYDEVSGVEVKEKDQDLSDRIYTVMYVERLYESYENNMLLNRPDKALDALLRGLQKYDEHYDEAVQLDIVEDIDACRSKIIAALFAAYGISETQAYEIMQLEGQAYTQMLIEYSNALQTGE